MLWCVVFLFFRRHTASPLTLLRRRKDPAALGERNPDALPHAGQVHELTKHFTSIQSPPATSPHRKSSTSPRRSRAGSRNSSHVPIIVGQDIHPILSDTNEQKRRSVTRPHSWDYVPVGLVWRILHSPNGFWYLLSRKHGLGGWGCGGVRLQTSWVGLWRCWIVD